MGKVSTPLPTSSFPCPNCNSICTSDVRSHKLVHITYFVLIETIKMRILNEFCETFLKKEVKISVTPNGLWRPTYYSLNVYMYFLFITFSWVPFTVTSMHITFQDMCIFHTNTFLAFLSLHSYLFSVSLLIFNSLFLFLSSLCFLSLLLSVYLFFHSLFSMFYSLLLNCPPTLSMS